MMASPTQRQFSRESAKVQWRITTRINGPAGSIDASLPLCGSFDEGRRMFNMNEPAVPVTITLRIPGKWSQPRELIQCLPDGYRLTPEALILPDTTQVEFSAMKADNQFAQIFRSSCRQPATEEELATVRGYKVNVCL